AATASSVLLEGTPVMGETWTVSINGNAATTYSVVVNATIDTLEEIAAALASQIRADDGDAPTFTAATDGRALVIVNRAGTAFTTAFALTLPASQLPGAATI